MAGRFGSPWFKLLRYGFEYYGRFYGTYRGVVITNYDPENMGRLQIKVPSVDGQFNDSSWAWPKGQWGGEGYGMQIIPNKGDLVWVEYLNGDSRYPVWLHAGFSKNQKPEEFKHSNVYGFKTPKGHIITIDDDESILTIKNPSGETIEISEGLIKQDGKEIQLGADNLQPAVKGDELFNTVNKILSALTTTTVPTSIGPMPLTSAATFAQIQAQDLPKIKSTKVKVE